MLVLSKQYYGRGETPVYLAYVDKTDGTAADPADYAEIRMTHGSFSQTFNGRILVPVIEDFPVPLGRLLVATVDSPEAFDGTSTEPFDYNFIFMPGDLGVAFYPEPGTYRTMFELRRTDGRIETMTFESVCVEKFTGLTINFGEIPTFSGTVRTKAIAEAGDVAYVTGKIVGITRTVILEATGEILNDASIPLSALNTETENNFSHTPEENIFPVSGGFFVRLMFWHEDNSPPGVIEINIEVV